MLLCYSIMTKHGLKEHHLSCLESHSSSLKVVNGKQKFLIPLCLVLLKFLLFSMYG